MESNEQAKLAENPAVNKDLVNIYRRRIIDAYRQRKVFTVYGSYASVRKALIKRGWIEKLCPGRFSKLQKLSEHTLLQNVKKGNVFETVLISKMISNLPVFFLWQPKEFRDIYKELKPYRNRIRRSALLDFTSKVGLIGCAQQQGWFSDSDRMQMIHPRFYYLSGSNAEEMSLFTEEYRQTQYRSVLRFLVSHENKLAELIDCEKDEYGTASLSLIQFALARVQCQLNELECDCFMDTKKEFTISNSEWHSFFEDSKRFINGAIKINCCQKELKTLLNDAKTLLQKMEECRPDYKWDGYRNLWILKPGYQCRGTGIRIHNQLNDIIGWASSHHNRSYIVQKYIETPLLIYQTKFDIRQYMLICCRQSTLQIWLYHECYLRLSSREFNMDDLREVIHLTNFTVQKRYNTQLDSRLPQNNMWSLEQFKQFLKQQPSAPDNVNEFWKNTIFSGFRKNLIAVVLASLDDTELRENCFELFGCDFMLAEDFTPILIEINANPDLSPSTEITARLCPKMLEDLIKVVIDGQGHHNASNIGKFELVYELDWKYRQADDANDVLNIKGKVMQIRHAQKPKAMNKRNKANVASQKQPKNSKVATSGVLKAINNKSTLKKSQATSAALPEVSKNPESETNFAELVNKSETISLKNIKEAFKSGLNTMLPTTLKQIMAIHYAAK